MYVSCAQATSAGAKAHEATNWLEKRIEANPEPDEASTTQMAIMCLQHVLSSDFKGSDLEVGVVSVGGRFTMLNEVTFLCAPCLHGPFLLVALTPTASARRMKSRPT